MLCGVINPHDLDGLLSDAVNRDIGRGGKQNLAGAFLTSGTGTPGPFLQLADTNRSTSVPAWAAIWESRGFLLRREMYFHAFKVRENRK